MFGIKPKLPVSDQARHWIDHHLDWLRSELGRDFAQLPVILPTPEFFPEEWSDTTEYAHALFRRVCGYMQVDPARILLEIEEGEDPTGELSRSLPYWEGRSSGAAGLYRHALEAERCHITVRRDQIRAPEVLIAVMAHELGHVLLLGDRRIEWDRPDMEPLTDLVTVAQGLGLFGANACIRFSTHQNVRSAGWSIQRTGYLTEEAWGYALARFAWRRGEPRPAWVKHLSRNVGAYCQQSLKFLAWETAQTLRHS